MPSLIRPALLVILIAAALHAGAAPAQGLSATYFDNADFTGATIARIDPEIAFAWGVDAPDPALGADGFSARWTGRVTPLVSELHAFHVRCDDGARLWVDGVLIIDRWVAQGPTEHSASMALVAGRSYDLKLEYFENTGGAVVELRWSSPSTPKAIIPAARLSPTGGDMQVGSGDGLLGCYHSSRDLSGTPRRRVDRGVAFAWGAAAPMPELFADDFSVRWLGEVAGQYDDTYTFHVRADDGVRLWVANRLLVDAWREQGPTEYSGTVALKAGVRVPIRLEYFERTGNAQIDLRWSGPRTSKGLIPVSQLYATGGLSPVIPAESATSPAFVEGLRWSPDGSACTVSASGAASCTSLGEVGFCAEVVLDPAAARTVAFTHSQTAVRRSASIAWKPTALDQLDYGTSRLLVRAGDSLLLTAGSSGAPGRLDIAIRSEPPGGSAPASHVGKACGARLPTRFPDAGRWIVNASIDGRPAGSLTVVAVACDLHGPIPCQVGYQRTLTVAAAPADEAGCPLYGTPDPARLAVAPAPAPAAPGTLLLRPAIRQDAELVARLWPDGPIIARESVRAFTVESLNRAVIAVVGEDDGFASGTLRVRITPRLVIDNDRAATPEREGLHLDLRLKGSGVFFTENGQTALRLPSTRQDADGVIETAFKLSPGGGIQCHDIKAVQINSPETPVGETPLNNPCLVRVCRAQYAHEVTNPSTSAPDKRRQAPKRFHCDPAKEGRDQSVLWGQTRRFVFVGADDGDAGSFQATIIDRESNTVPQDVLTLCEPSFCTAPVWDAGAITARCLALLGDPTAKVRPEIFYSASPDSCPHGTYGEFNPAWAPLRRRLPDCGDPPPPLTTTATCRGCTVRDLFYVHRYGTFDLRLSPAGGGTDGRNSGLIKDAIRLFRLTAVGDRSEEARSVGAVPEPDGTVFPDLVGVVDQAGPARIDVAGGEPCLLRAPTTPSRKGVVAKGTHVFRFRSVIDPAAEAALPVGASLRHAWTFGDGTGSGRAVTHSFTPGRRNVLLTVTLRRSGPGDLDGNGKVDGADQALVTANSGRTPADPAWDGNADANRDGVVDAGDAAAVSANSGKTYAVSEEPFATARLDSFDILAKECDREQPHPGYLAAADRHGVPVRILARGPKGATVNVELVVKRRGDLGSAGQGRVSLNGRAEDEHLNGFAAGGADSARRVEGLPQYFSAVIDGLDHFPPDSGGAGVATAPIAGHDPEHATAWVVFLQGMDVNDVADNVELITSFREVRPRCPNSDERQDRPVCDCVYTPTDWEAFNPVRVQILRGVVEAASGRAASGGPGEVLRTIPREPGLQVSDPVPQVRIDTLNVTNTRWDASAGLRGDIQVSGSVTFALSDAIGNGDADLDSSSTASVIEVAGVDHPGLALTRVDESPTFLRPFAKRFTFSRSLSGIPITDRITRVAVKVTDPVLGNTGFGQASVRVVAARNRDTPSDLVPDPPAVLLIGNPGLQPLTVRIDFRGARTLAEMVAAGPAGLLLEAREALAADPAPLVTAARMVIDAAGVPSIVAADAGGFRLIDSSQLTTTSPLRRFFLAEGELPTKSGLGTLRLRFEETAPGSNRFASQFVDLTVRFTAPPADAAVDRVTVEVRKTLFDQIGPVAARLLTETAAGSLIFADGDLRLGISDLTGFDPRHRDLLTATLDAGSLAVAAMPVQLLETGPATGVFAIHPATGAIQSWVGDYAEAWVNGPIVVSETTGNQGSAPGPYFPLVVEVLGVPAVLDALLGGRGRITVFQDVAHDVVKVDGRYFSSGSDKTGIFVAVGNLKPPARHGAGHIDETGRFVFAVLADSAAGERKIADDQKLRLATARRIFDQLADIAQARRQARFGANPGATYQPAYAAGAASEPVRVYSQYLFDHFLSRHGPLAVLANRRAALADLTTRVSDVFGGQVPGTANRLFGFAVEGKGRPAIPLLTVLQPGTGSAGPVVGSRFLLGHWGDGVGNIERDFTSQSQNLSDIYHVNNGMGWFIAGTEAGFGDRINELLPILTNAVDADAVRKHKIMKWLDKFGYLAGGLDQARVGGAPLTPEAKAALLAAVRGEGAVARFAAAAAYDAYVKDNRFWKELVDTILVARGFTQPKDPTAIDLYIGYEVASEEGFHVFGIDAFNDVIATAAGKLFAEELLKDPSAIAGEGTVNAQVEQKMADARAAFLAHPLLKDKKAKNLEAFFSVLVAMDGTDFATQVKNGLRGPPGGADLSNEIIWQSTLGGMVEKVKDRWKDDKDGAKETAFITALIAHVRDITKRLTAFAGPNGEALSEVDVRVLSEIVEMRMLLDQ